MKGFKHRMKKNMVLCFLLISIWGISGCAKSVPQEIKPSPFQDEKITGTQIPLPLTVSPIPSPSQSLTPVVTITPKISYQVIDISNANSLVLLHTWEMDWIAPFGKEVNWSPNSKTFFIYAEKGTFRGFLSFDAVEFDSNLVMEEPTPSIIIVNAAEDLFSYDNSLIMSQIDGQKEIFSVGNCPYYKFANAIINIPNTSLLVTGHTVNDRSDMNAKTTLLLWHDQKKSCQEAFSTFDGKLITLTSSSSGNYISYNVAKFTDATGRWDTITLLYDLDLRKAKCSLPGYLSGFAQNDLVVYDVATNTISLFDISNCDRLKEFDIDHNISVLAIHPGGNLLVGGGENTVGIWDINTGTKLGLISPQEPDFDTLALGFSPDGRFLVGVFSGKKPRIKIWGTFLE